MWCVLYSIAILDCKINNVDDSDKDCEATDDGIDGAPVDEEVCPTHEPGAVRHIGSQLRYNSERSFTLPINVSNNQSIYSHVSTSLPLLLAYWDILHFTGKSY